MRSPHRSTPEDSHLKKSERSGFVGSEYPPRIEANDHEPTSMSVEWQHCRENFERRESDALQQREAHRQHARRVVLAAIAQVAPIYPLVKRVYLLRANQ